MIYFAADLHLIRYMWRGRKELDGDSYRALQSMATAILTDETDEDKTLIVAGDVFEQARVDGLTLSKARDVFRKLNNAGVSILYISGNHDRNTVPHMESIGLEHVQYIDRATCSVDGRKVYGLNWCPREVLHEQLQEVPEDTDLLVMHAMFEHMIDFAAAADLSMEDLPPQVGSVVVGDIHVADLTFRDKTTWVLSPGPLHACNIEQSQPKCIWKLAKGAVEPQQVPIEYRPIYRLELTEDNVDTVFDDVATEDEPIVELTYCTDLQEAAQALIAQYGDQVVFFPKPYGSKLAEAVEEDDESEQVTVPDVIPRVVDPAKQKRVHDLMQALWKEDPEEVLHREIVRVLEGEEEKKEEEFSPDDIDITDFE